MWIHDGAGVMRGALVSALSRAGFALGSGLLIAVLGISLIVAPVVANQVWAEHGNGDAGQTFTANEVVYVSGDLDQTSEDAAFPYSARVYVTRDLDHWNYGQGLLDLTGSSGSYNVVVGSSMGSAFFGEIVWLPMLTVGRYDIVLDENQNGIYDCDQATGVCDVVVGDPATSGDFAFQVLPPTGAPVVDKVEIKKHANIQAIAYEQLPNVVNYTTAALGIWSTTASFAVAWSPMTGMIIGTGVFFAESNVKDLYTSYDSYTIGMGITLLKQIGGPLAAKYKALADDPPDAAFETVTELGPVPYHPALAEDGFSRAQADTANALEEEGALVVALTHSLEKLDGALAANDPAAIVRQARMVKTYADLLASNSEDSANQIGTLAGEVKNHGGDRVIRAADVIGYQQHVASSGFSAAELDDMRAAGLTGAEIASFRQYVTTMKTDGLADFNEYQVWLDLRDSTAAGVPTLRTISDQATAMIEYYGYSVDDIYPVASAGGPYTGTEGTAVALSAAASTDPNGDALRYAWDLDGDGAFDDGSSASVSNTWSGEYRGLVGVRVTDPDGYADTAYAPVRIGSANRAPVMGATSPADSIVATQPGGTISFSAEATDPDGDAVTFRWYLAGAEVATGPAWSSTVTEADAGDFVVVVADDGSPFSTDPFARWRIAMPGVVAEGPISVTSAPAGASIVLDGVDTGRVTPAVLEGVSLGEHTVSVSLSGYMVPEAKTVTVTATGTATADFALVSPQFLDTFDDNSLDTAIWTVNQEGGARIAETNQQLEVTIPPESTGELISAGVLSRGKIRGDFDIRIGYRVIEWPPHNGVRIGIHFGEPGIEQRILERVSYSENNDGNGQESYTTFYYGGDQQIYTPTTDTSGTLRLVRQGSTVTAYYADADHWVPYTSGWTTTGDVSFGFSGWSHDPVFAGKPVRFALDNFVVASGDLVFPEGPPIVDAGTDATATEGGSVAFAGSFTDTGDTGAHTVTWDFGDGGTASTLEATHAYADNGAYTATLTVTDTAGQSASDTRTITVANANPAVDAGADQAATAGSPVNFAGSFTDAGTADTHTATWNWGDGTGDTPGTVAGGSATGIHAYVAAGSYTATLTVTDDDGGTGTDTVTVTVENTAPVAHDDDFSTAEDQELAVPAATGVLANDEVHGTPSLAVGAGPAHGTVTLEPTGAFTYTPAADYHGPDSFTYTVSDGTLAPVTATVSITVTPVNDAPVAASDQYGTDEDTTLEVDAPGLLGNDHDVDSASLSAALVAAPAHGSVTVDPDGSFTYVPAAGHSGADSFTYQASDGTTTSAAATVSIDVRPVADDAVPAGDIYTTAEDRQLEVPAPGVLANDANPDGGPITAMLQGTVTHGTLSLAADGSFSYTPEENWNGQDTFTYTCGAAASATVTITVTPVNDAPTASPDSYRVDENAALTVPAPGLLTNDADIDGDSLAAEVVAGPAHGSLDLEADGSFVYTPAPGYGGPDSFSYHASDGTAPSTPAMVTLTVNAVNHAPTARDDSYQTTAGSALDVPAPGVLANDDDEDGDALTAALVATTTHGNLALSADGSYRYTPAAGFSGSDTFTYRARDGIADSEPATVSISVQPAENHPPVITGITVPLDPKPVNTAITADATFTDPDAGDSWTSTWTWDDGATTAGTVTGGSVSGTHTYTTAGVYTISLTVNDGTAGTTASSSQYTVIYDPAGGFVTGGGWITSPAGAYTAKPGVNGKATFSFEAKYQKGASAPKGKVLFKIGKDDFTFRSTTEQWLVVTGAKAQYYGIGTVNGVGAYPFILTSIDGDVIGKGTPDLFRLKVWDRVTGETVYDNKMSAPDTDDPVMVLGGGSIVIHKN